MNLQELGVEVGSREASPLPSGISVLFVPFLPLGPLSKSIASNLQKVTQTFSEKNPGLNVVISPTYPLGCVLPWKRQAGGVVSTREFRQILRRLALFWKNCGFRKIVLCGASEGTEQEIAFEEFARWAKWRHGLDVVQVTNKWLIPAANVDHETLLEMLNQFAASGKRAPQLHPARYFWRYLGNQRHVVVILMIYLLGLAILWIALSRLTQEMYK